MLLKVKKLTPVAKLPTYTYPGDAAMDVYSLHNIKILPGETVIAHTGLAFAVPEGWEMQIRSRSGLASQGIVVANSPGTLDAGYRGELRILLHNNSQGSLLDTFRVREGDRVAQILVKPAPLIRLREVDELDNTERGEGGLGSTGS